MEAETKDFVILAKELAEDPLRRAEAREICFRGLNSEPDHKLGRLLLARLFYLDNLYEFAARELAELADSGDLPAVEKILAEFGPLGLKYRKGKRKAPSSETEGVVAEIDIDSSFLDVLDELKKEQDQN